MGKMPTDSSGKSSESKLHCFCLFDAYSMPKEMYSVCTVTFGEKMLTLAKSRGSYVRGYGIFFSFSLLQIHPKFIPSIPPVYSQYNSSIQIYN